jgi:hypothetical protein
VQTAKFGRTGQHQAARVQYQSQNTKLTRRCTKSDENHHSRILPPEPGASGHQRADKSFHELLERAKIPMFGEKFGG